MQGIFEKRREQVRKRMEEEGMEGALVLHPTNIYYLTGYLADPHERFMGLFLFRSSEEVFLVPQLERERANAYLKEVVSYTDDEGPLPLIRKIMTDLTEGVFGVEKEVITLERVEWLKEISPSLIFRSLHPFLAKLRGVKSREEQDLLRRAGKMLDEILMEGIRSLKKGMTERQMVTLLEGLAKERGVQRMSFDTMVLSGPKSALPHGIPEDRPILEGEYLLFDLGIPYQGYHSDITRTFFLGKPTKRHEMVYKTVLKAQQSAISMVKPGILYRSLDEEARRVIEAEGYGSYFIHRLGHGLGLDVHEFPSVHGHNGEIVEVGNVFTVEPGIYIPDFGGVRIEDDVIVTAQGAETFTGAPKEWEEMILSFS
ncbi:M24 family metallopeptidase [Thermicanus aegyptius]|uniref:M24 family metallopeptidase n=1 Tax=Thermicanus aegyptius TaxID=94009 RepID=UPI00041E380E|nr:Xaa-Pro peptidase family protein [Thermicanus aegyptius]